MLVQFYLFKIFAHKFDCGVPDQVRQWVDIEDVRVLPIDEVPGGVDERFVEVLNNDEQIFASLINRWRLSHNHGTVTPVYI